MKSPLILISTIKYKISIFLFCLSFLFISGCRINKTAADKSIVKSDVKSKKIKKDTFFRIAIFGYSESEDSIYNPDNDYESEMELEYDERYDQRD